jgi:hypothetical protein
MGGAINKVTNWTQNDVLGLNKNATSNSMYGGNTLGAQINRWGYNAMTDVSGTDVFANKNARDKVIAQQPGAAPDATDAAIHLAAENQAQATLRQRGRKSTFLGSATLDPSAPPKSLLGG